MRTAAAGVVVCSKLGGNAGVVLRGAEVPPLATCSAERGSTASRREAACIVHVRQAACTWLDTWLDGTSSP